MNTRIVFAIARKDLTEASQNQAVWLPMIIVPIIFLVIMPLAFILVPTQAHIAPEEMLNFDLAAYLAKLPPSMASRFVGLDLTQQMILLILGYLFAPMFLIFPLMYSTTIAAESFAGERERKTLEALLYTPASDAELFLGKVIAAGVPGILVSWLGFILYTIVVNSAGWQVFGGIWFPLPTWFPLIFWVTPAFAVFGVALTVLISTRNQTFMGAYQTSTSTVVLVLGLVIGQVAGVLYFTVLTGLIVGVLIWLVAGVLTWFAIRTFNRPTLLISAC
jgi:ABC-2 type transport system permease protein